MLDLVGVNNINQVQQQALDSRLRHPADLRARRDPRLQDDVPGAARPRPAAGIRRWSRRTSRCRPSEATADGIKWTFNPMVDISRDPAGAAWSRARARIRILGSAIAAAKVRGYQGNNFAAPDKMAATVKHFAAYGAPVAGREYNTVDMSTQQLFNDYLPPYKAAVDAGAATVMGSFNSLNGVPEHGQPVHADDDPARRVGLRRDDAERLPGRPGARGLRLRRKRGASGAAGTDGRSQHRDGGTAGKHQPVTPPTTTTAAAARVRARSRWRSSTTRSGTC